MLSVQDTAHNVLGVCRTYRRSCGARMAQVPCELPISTLTRPIPHTHFIKKRWGKRALIRGAQCLHHFTTQLKLTNNVQSPLFTKSSPASTSALMSFASRRHRIVQPFYPVRCISGWMSNKSDIQPDTLHGDTQAQSYWGLTTVRKVTLKDSPWLTED